ncbi:Carboxylesterase, partial [Scytalidium lignicola]
MRATASILLACCAAASAYDQFTFEAPILEEGSSSSWTVGQTVQTSSGPVQGHAASAATQVSEYLGIPYAQPPVADLRFAPPEKYTGSDAINGSAFGYSCLASPRAPVSAANLAAAGITPTGVQILDSEANAITANEDCLTLNVWTKPQAGDAKKAVLVWIQGNSFTEGSSSNPIYNGQYFADQEDVVLVSFNYRLGIFGFPGSTETRNNLGLLDQRLALEWVRDNIEAFGGDSSRITIFGQSAGAASVDYYAFAWTEDPIVSGLICESGTAFSFGLPSTPARSAASWTRVAGDVGCGLSSDPAAVLACMRTKDAREITKAVPARLTSGRISDFGPTIDNKVIFNNYATRAAAGQLIKAPLLLGNTDNEAGLFVAASALQGATHRTSYWADFNAQGFDCPASYRANASISSSIPTWRYRWFGSFPNTDIYSGSGAYHSSEVSLLFNNMIQDPAPTAAEISIANYMRGAWAAFAKSPETGLTTYSGGWPVYDPSKPTLIRLGYNSITGTNLGLPSYYDSACSSSGAAPLHARDIANGVAGINVRTIAGGSSFASFPSSIPTSFPATVIPPSATGSAIPTHAPTAAVTGSSTTSPSAPPAATANGASSLKVSSSVTVLFGAVFAAYLLV